MANRTFNYKDQEDKWSAYWASHDDTPKTRQMIWVRSDGFYMPKNNTRDLIRMDQPNPQVTYSISWVAAEDGVQIVSSTIEKPCQPRHDNTSYSFYSGVLKEGDEFKIEWVTPEDNTFFYSASGTNCTHGMFGGFNLADSDIEKYGELTNKLLNVSTTAPEGGYYGTTGMLLQDRFQPQPAVNGSRNGTTSGDSGESSDDGIFGGLNGHTWLIVICVGAGVLVLVAILVWFCIRRRDRNTYQEDVGM